MKFLRLFIFLVTLSVLTAAADETPGMLAFLERNYGAALRLLPKEIAQFVPGSDLYWEHTFAYIESSLFYGHPEDAAEKIDDIKDKVPSKLQSRFNLLQAQLAYVNNDLKSCGEFLQKVSSEAGFSPVNRYDFAVLKAETEFAEKHYAESLAVLDAALKDEELVACGEFNLKSLQMRGLAAAGQLKNVAPVYEDLKNKYPAEQKKLQYFELLVFAIEGNLKAYRELFNRLFVEEKDFIPFIGDEVLFQSALLAEQQGRKENNDDEVIFHLKNQTRFAPTDEYRLASFHTLIELLLANNRKKDALAEVLQMQKMIADIPDSAKWMMLTAQLQYELNVGDLGLSIFLKLKNDSAADVLIRVRAAKNAAAIYKAQGKKTEMLKLYAFLSDMPGNRKVNDEGLLLAGRYYFENHEYRMGESIFSKIQPDSDFYSEALFYRIQCEIANGEYKSAAADVSELAKLQNDSKNTSLPEYDLAVLYFQAQLAEADSKYELAAELYEKVARTGSVRPSAQNMIYNSWLKAAQLNFDRQLYSHAGLLFLTFAEKYPASGEAVQVLYNSVYSYFLAGRFEEMEYSISKMRKAYPAEELTINALFHKMDYLRQNDQLQDALQVLEEIEASAKDKNAEIISQCIYDKALTLYQLRREKDALAELDKLLNNNDSLRCADGNFLAATILSEQGEHLSAAEKFLEASNFYLEPLLKYASLGRAADNYFLAGSSKKDNELLLKAANVYADAVKKQELPQIFRLQCLYKWGRCLEAAADFQGALDAYTEALYFPYNNSNEKNNAVIAIWVNRSAKNAIDIHLRQGGANALNDALFIVRRLKTLNTMSAEDIDALEYNIRMRYMQHE